MILYKMAFNNLTSKVQMHTVLHL